MFTCYGIQVKVGVPPSAIWVSVLELRLSTLMACNFNLWAISLAQICFLKWAQTSSLFCYLLLLLSNYHSLFCVVMVGLSPRRFQTVGRYLFCCCWTFAWSPGWGCNEYCGNLNPCLSGYLCFFIVYILGVKLLAYIS